MCDRFPQKFDVQTSFKTSKYVLRPIFVVNIKFPRATYHTIVPSTMSTEKLYCLTMGIIPTGQEPDSYIIQYHDPVMRSA